MTHVSEWIQLPVLGEERTVPLEVLVAKLFTRLFCVSSAGGAARSP